MNLATLFFESNLGWVRIIASHKGITRIDFTDPDNGEPSAQKFNEGKPNEGKSNQAETEVPNAAANQHLQDAKHQLQEYFSGTRTQFDLPLDPVGTPFQKEVWAVLNTIPYGKTCTYKHIADQVNRPKGSQAIGQANGKNPISIVVPCHRVIGSNGKLTGYAGGLHRKEALLKQEEQNTVTS